MAKAVSLPQRDAPDSLIQTHRRRFLTRALTAAVLLVLGVLFAFPFLWTLGTSLKTTQETQYFPPALWPETPQWGNYVQVWVSQPMARWLINSAHVILLAVPIAIVLNAMVAYAFARFDFPGRQVLFLAVLMTMMIPAEVRLIPQYLLFLRLGWLDTYYPLVVPNWLGATGSSVVTIFLLRQFFMTIPRDLDAAATIDGANSWQILWQIILPLSKPALATVAILLFLAEWNDFFGPLIFLNSVDLFTMALGLRYFQAEPQTSYESKAHLLMAATVIMTVPTIILFFAAQRYFIRGIVMSGLKG